MIANSYRILVVGQTTDQWLIDTLSDLGHRPEMARQFVLNNDFDLVIVRPTTQELLTQLLQDLNPKTLKTPWWLTNVLGKDFETLFARYEELDIHDSNRIVFESPLIPWRLQELIKTALNSASWADRVWA
jgi:hypothetical protein